MKKARWVSNGGETATRFGVLSPCSRVRGAGSDNFIVKKAFHFNIMLGSPHKVCAGKKMTDHLSDSGGKGRSNGTRYHFAHYSRDWWRGRGFPRTLDMQTCSGSRNDPCTTLSPDSIFERVFARGYFGASQARAPPPVTSTTLRLRLLLALTIGD